MSDQKNSEQRRSHGSGIVFGAALAIPAGMIFGLTLNNLALGVVFGLSIGIVFAVAFGANWSGKSRPDTCSSNDRENNDSARRTNGNEP